MSVVGIDASRANHEQKTGVEWYAWQLIEELKKVIPPNVRVILYSDAPLVGALAHLPPNWHSRVLPWPPGRLWTQLRLSLEMLLKPPDVLFIPAHVYPFIHPHRTVMTVHDIAAYRHPQSYSWFERWYTLWSARQAVHRLARVIVPTVFTKQELLIAFHPEEANRIVVIPHGFHPAYGLAIDPERATAILRQYGISQPFLLSVGRLEYKKNTARIVAAFNSFANLVTSAPYQLVLVGPPGYGYEAVRGVVKTSPYRERIRELGWVPVEHLAAIMKAAAVFVFPSLYEGFGLPVLEALAAGVPVVASRGTSLPEVGGDAVLYVDPLDTAELANLLQKMVTTEFSRARRNSGEERVKHFSWAKCAAATWTQALSPLLSDC
ncbi:MAG: glycosyltransferase family 4 protein [Candidatus Magasanikbacteria bacterium]|nr:glycosyltransferase family 4 protein [Candidatus Magasanikbacteria bacterium]